MKSTIREKQYVSQLPPSWLQQELRLLYAFISDDISSTIIPASIMTFAAWKVSSHSWVMLPADLLRAFVYFTFYIYIFCLSNQIVGLDEDQLNKPHRPLVRQLTTIHGAKWRLAIATIIFALLGVWWNVLGWTMVWIAATIAHNQGKWSRHWVGKHALMAVGIIAQLGAAWEMILPMSGSAWRWIATIAWLMLPLVGIQDLRDVDGDREVQRHTLPLVWGATAVRFWLGALLLALPILLHYGLFAFHAQGLATVICESSIAGLCWLLALRVVWLRSHADDHQTYVLFTYWYCAMLVSAAVLL